MSEGHYITYILYLTFPNFTPEIEVYQIRFIVNHTHTKINSVKRGSHSSVI